ncbi:RHS repeat-associated core domain-containing protein [Paraburkholderia antibiotica]|uniref:RHS repeat-associated core domain-containing protein n=1 Tax=Paraburkholderia antibiotica TaxID=2728839 RepID=UPI0038B29F82
MILTRCPASKPACSIHRPESSIELVWLHRETGRTHAAFSQQREYDPAGRLTRFVVKPASATGPHERIAERRLQYSAAGHLTRIEDRTRGVTGYTYDPVGRLLKSVTPDLTEIFAFDPAGNPVDAEKMTPPPVVETPQEKAERFARKSAEDTAWLRAHPDEQYPPLRHNKRGSDDAAKLDEWKRSLLRCIGNVLVGLNRTRYDYDARGNLGRRVEPDGRTWVYRHDAANRLEEASCYARASDAEGAGRTAARAERVVRFRYDAFGRRTLKEVERPGGGIDRTVFTWDGDVLLMEERFHEPPRRTGEFRPYQYRAARLVREDAQDPYSLPVAQRMHTLDDRHQWRAASIYLHEPGSFVPLARLDESMVEPAYLATGTDGRFVQMPATTRHATLFYQNDHLGTPQELTDESGKVVWLARYRAWGGWKDTWRERPDPVGTANALRFQGQYCDDETGLHYDRYRYYDPGTGRFISKDPIGLAGGINVYAYAPNPVGWVDPFGLEKSYQTYTKTNPVRGQVYTGRTSGDGDPLQNILARDRDHHMTSQGYGPARLDQSSANRCAIRGREQAMIEANGGARSMGGTSGNAINGISPSNPKLSTFMEAAEAEFGAVGGGGGANLPHGMIPNPKAEIPYE